MTVYLLNDMSEPYGQYTALAEEAVTSGDFLKPTGSVEATTSNYSTPVSSSLLEVSKSDATGDEALLSGIAMDTQATAGQTVSVGTSGIHLLQANEAITAGNMLCQIAAAASMKVIAAEAGGRQLGIALTACSAQDEYVLVDFKLGPTGAEA